jgi:hypothetical protein
MNDPLLAAPEDQEWQAVWSSDHPDYNGPASWNFYATRRGASRGGRRHSARRRRQPPKTAGNRSNWPPETGTGRSASYEA